MSISLKRLIYHDNHKLTSGRLSRFQSPLVVKSSQGRTSSNDLGRKFRVRSCECDQQKRSFARARASVSYILRYILFLHFRSFSLQRTDCSIHLPFPSQAFPFLPSVFLRSACFLLFSVSLPPFHSVPIYVYLLFLLILSRFFVLPLLGFFSLHLSSQLGFRIFVRNKDFEFVPRESRS